MHRVCGATGDIYLKTGRIMEGALAEDGTTSSQCPPGWRRVPKRQIALPRRPSVSAQLMARVACVMPITPHYTQTVAFLRARPASSAPAPFISIGTGLCDHSIPPSLHDRGGRLCGTHTQPIPLEFSPRPTGGTGPVCHVAWHVLPECPRRQFRAIFSPTAAVS